MHQGRTERAAGSDAVVPDIDVAIAVASVAAKAIGLPGGAAETIRNGCFNAGVAKMLTHWKEN